MKEFEIRASYDADTITVYQAYRPAIALAAVEHQKFVSPFKLERMTWIKPSFLWMMYRSGWAQKEGQEHVLAIKIKREGWEWALQNSCLSHFNTSLGISHDDWKKQLQNAPVRIQWDPEKDIHLHKLNYRSIQVGLSGEAVPKYVNDWIVEVTDITDIVKSIKTLLLEGKVEEAQALLPKEALYELSAEIKQVIQAS